MAVSWDGLGGRPEKRCPLVAGAELSLLRAETVSRHQRPRVAGSGQTSSDIWECMGQGVCLSPLLCLVCVCVSCLIVSNSLQLAPRSVAYQGPPSMEFSRQEYWTGWPFPSVSYKCYYCKETNIFIIN